MSLFESKHFIRALWLLLILTIIFVGEKVSFVFFPILVIFRVFFVPIAFAMILYYILVPVVDWLQKKKIKRIYGVSLLFVAIITLLVISSLLFGATLQRQFMKLVAYIPDLPQNINATFMQIREHPLFERFQDSDFFFFERFSEVFSNALRELFSRIGSDISSMFSVVSNTVIGIILIPVFLFYMLLDASEIRRKIVLLIPKRKREMAEKIITEVDKGLNAFIQGRVIVSLFVGVISYIGFLIIGIEAPLVLAIIIFFTNFIPYVGPIIGSIPALIISLFVSFSMAMQVLLLIVIVQQIESIVISPQVMSKKLSMHPLIVLITIMLGGHFAGILGVIFAVPFYVIIKVIIVNVLPEFNQEAAESNNK